MQKNKAKEIINFGISSSVFILTQPKSLDNDAIVTWTLN